MAARLHEIHLYTGDVAINDQWKIEAADLLAPWLNGTLTPTAFFAPHFEHVPMWTRLTAWLTVVLTGRWDPLVQATVNSLLFCSFTVLVVQWVTANLRTVAALAVSLLIVVGAALPHAWENITWGFQSQFPFALLFLFLHVKGSFTRPEGSAGWCCAQLAGLAGLFTLAGMWIAPLAVILTQRWIQPRKLRMQYVPLAIAAVGLGIIFYIRATAPANEAFAQTTGSTLKFLHASFDLLGWPAGWPGALALLNLPLLFFALQLRGRELSTAFDRIVLTLGFWGVGQATALAYARGADYGGYVSRYGELLAILVLANALALIRLVPSGRRWRAATVTFTAVWFIVVLTGWWQLSTGGHTRYFHIHATENASIRREAVQAYLQHRDRNLLELPSTRWVLYQVVDQITSLLDDPSFCALLPSSVNPANPPDPAGKFARFIQRHFMLLGGGALLLFLIGVTGFPLFTSTVQQPLAIFSFSPVALHPALPTFIALAATTLMLCWPAPFTFSQSSRWRLILAPASNVGPLEVQIVTGSSELPGERLIGAAPLSPPAMRDLFTGTAPGGPALTCTAWSKPFPIHAPWFVVPYAGWPVAHGNGLRLRIEESNGKFITELACSGPNQSEVTFWTADVRAYVNKQARLVIYDGRTETEAWVAAAPPIPTGDEKLGKALEKRMQWEALASLHTSLGVVAVVSLLCVFIASSKFRN